MNAPEPRLRLRFGSERPPEGGRGRAFGLAIGTSALAHLAVIAVGALAYTATVRVLFPRAFDAPETPRVYERITYIDISDFPVPPVAEPPAPAEPRVEPAPPPPEPEPPAPTVEAAPAPEPAGPAGSTVGQADPEPTATPTGTAIDPGLGPDPPLTLAQRVQPRAGDPRIWAAFGDAQVEPTEEERAQIMLNAFLQDFNDSIAVAEAVMDRATDWTYTDDDGNRWGIASGRLYVGDYSIPLPSLNIAPNRLANAQQQRIMNELARGVASSEMRQIQGDRARAVVEYVEAEKERAREAAAADPPVDQDPR